MCDQQRLGPACAYAQSDQSLCKSLEYSMSVKLLSEHRLMFLNLKGGCIGSSESTLANVTLLEITCHGSYACNSMDIQTDRYKMGGTRIYYRLAPVLVFPSPEHTRK